MADLTIAVELAGRDSNATGVVNAVSSALHGLAGAAKAPTSALGGMLDTFGKMGMGVFGIKTLAESLGGLASGFVAGNTQMETYETQLGTLMGSADAARGRLQELAQFGASTPFELPEVVRAEKVLLGFGLTGEKVFKLTGQTGEQFRTTVGDIAAGTGASFEEIALNMGKFSAGATGEAMARFQEMGIATREQLAAMGVEFSKSGELLSPLPVAMTAITKLTQQKFGGGMQQLSETFGGQVSTLMDNFGAMQRTLAQPIFDVLKLAVAGANEAIGGQGFQKTLSNLATLLASGVQQGITVAVGAFNTLVDAATRLAPTVQMIYERVTTFFGALTTGQGIAASVNAAFGDLIPPELNPLLDAIDAGFRRVRETVGSLVQAFQSGGLVGVWQQVTAAMSEFAPTGERIASAIGTIRDAVLSFVPQPIKDFVSGLLAMGENAAEGASPLSTLAAVINQVSSAVQSVTEFIRDNVAVQATLVGALTAAAVAWGVQATIQAYAKAMAIADTVTKAFAATQAALTAIMTANPIGLVVVALAALTAALIYAYNNSETFREIVDDTFKTLKDVTTSAISAAVTAFGVFRNAINTAISAINSLSSSTGQGFASIRQAVSAAMDAAQTAVTGTWNAITNAVNSAVSNIRNNIETGFGAIRSLIETVQAAIRTTIMTVWNALPEDIRRDAQAIYDNLSGRFEAMRTKIADEMQNIRTRIESTWTTISGFIRNIVTAIYNEVSARWQALSAVVATAMQAIQTVVTEAWAAIQAAVATAIEAVRAVVETAWNAILTTITTIMGSIQATVSAAWEAVRAAVDEKIQAAMAIIRGWGKDIAAFLGGLKETVGSLASEIGSAIVNGIRSGMNAVWQALVDWATQQIRDLLASMARAIGAKSPSQMAEDDIGAPIIQGVTQGMQRELPGAIAQAKDAAQQIVSNFAGAPGGAISWWAGIGGEIGKVIVVGIGRGIKDNTDEVLRSIDQFRNDAESKLGDFDRRVQDWIARAVAHRTELLRIFNYQAFLRGEGTKVLPELLAVTEEYEKSVRSAVQKAANSLEKVARDFAEAVSEARAEALQAAQDAADQASSQVAQLYANFALNKQIQAQRDAFAQMQRDQKDHFNASQNALKTALSQQEQMYRIAFQAQLKLNRGPGGSIADQAVEAAQQQLDTQTELLRIRFQRDRDLSRATTEDEKSEIAARALEAEKALQDRLDEESYIANATKEMRLAVFTAQVEAEKQAALQALQDRQAEEIYIENQTMGLRQQIAYAQAEFDRQQAQAADEFAASMEAAALARQVAGIYAERDERIKAIQEALAKKEQELAKAAEKEREDILEQLKTQLEDYQREYLDKVVQAFHHAQVDIADFISAINDDLKKQTEQLTNDILDMAKKLNEVKQDMGNTPSYFVPTVQPVTPPPGGMWAPVTPTPTLPDNFPARVGGGPALRYEGGLPGQTVNNFNLTVNGNPSVNSAQQVGDVYRRMLVVAGR